MRGLDVFRSRRVLVIALLGFSSGLPLMLTGQTLGAWMVDEGVELRTIAAFSAVGLPYTFKWAWAPLLDRYQLPLLGRRRGWLLACQLGLIASIAAMGTIDPRTAPGALAVTAVVVAFLSASQDIVIDAFNVDTLRPEERAAGSAMYITGYRAAMLVTGALALSLAGDLPWHAIYGIAAGLVGLGVLGTLLAREPDDDAARPSTLVEAVWQPFARLLSQPGIAAVLLFVAWFRLCDFFATLMAVPFLKKGLGFSFDQIATMYQLLGFAGTLVGGTLGGGLVARIGVRRCLLAFGLLQAVTNLSWALLATTGRSLPLLGFTVVLDNLAGAMAGGAFIAYLMSRCDRAYSATQFALLTSLSSLGMRLFGFAAADLIAATSWAIFWLATALLVVPALALVPLLPKAGGRS